MIALGSKVTDKATGLTGVVTVRSIEMNGNIMLHVQPKQLNEETGAPVDGIWVVEDRLVGGEQEPHADYPMEILGTQVTDRVTGFSGMATAIIVHTSGCVHINVQPKGVNKNGEPFKPHNFDIIRLEGPAIKPMTKREELAYAEAQPSPTQHAPRPTPPRSAA